MFCCLIYIYIYIRLSRNIKFCVTSSNPFIIQNHTIKGYGTLLQQGQDNFILNHLLMQVL
jgi:hypothetical protein